MDVSLQVAGMEDADALALIGMATFLETFAGQIHGAGIIAHCQRVHAPDAYRSLLAADGTAAWLATVEPGAAPVGYALMARPQLPLDGIGPDDWEVKRIYALSRVHGTGTGRRLMQACVEEAEHRSAARLLLGTGKFNDKAIAFYERAGFQIVGERWFTVGAFRYDDWIMARAL